MIDTKLVYSGLVVVVIGMRLVELKLSNANIKHLKARGAVEVGFGQYPWMVAIHGAWLASCLLEVWLLDRPWNPILGGVMVVVFVSGSTLRYWTISTLGVRWSTRIVYVPDDPIESGGPFRWFRHPNYLGVAMEVTSLPLIHGGWITAILMTGVNGVLLKRRISVEEVALDSRMGEKTGGNRDVRSTVSPR